MFTSLNRCNDSCIKNLLEIKIDTKEFDMMLFLFSKIRKRSSQNVKKEQRFWIRNIFGKCLFLCSCFDFCQTGKDIS